MPAGNLLPASLEYIFYQKYRKDISTLLLRAVFVSSRHTSRSNNPYGLFCPLFPDRIHAYGENVLVLLLRTQFLLSADFTDRQQKISTLNSCVLFKD